MSLLDLNAAKDALVALTARITGFMNTVDADINQRKGEYDALAANLKDVVADEMFSEIQWRPSLAVDDPAQGHFKSWNSIVDYLNERARGSKTILYLHDDGQSFVFDRDLRLEDKSLLIRRLTGNEVTVQSKDNGNGENEFYQIVLSSGANLKIAGAAFHFGDLIFPGNSIAADAAFLSNDDHSNITLSYSSFTCASDGRVIYLNQWSGSSRVAFESVSLDGQIEGLGGSSEAIALLSVRGGSFANGATTHNATAFTLGQNLLLT